MSNMQAAHVGTLERLRLIQDGVTAHVWHLVFLSAACLIRQLGLLWHKQWT